MGVTEVRSRRARSSAPRPFHQHLPLIEPTPVR